VCVFTQSPGNLPVFLVLFLLSLLDFPPLAPIPIFVVSFLDVRLSPYLFRIALPILAKFLRITGTMFLFRFFPEKKRFPFLARLGVSLDNVQTQALGAMFLAFLSFPAEVSFSFAHCLRHTENGFALSPRRHRLLRFIIGMLVNTWVLRYTEPPPFSFLPFYLLFNYPSLSRFSSGEFPTSKLTFLLFNAIS